MAVVAGIDEAGFGPVLGPMVVSATVFRMPGEHMDVSMWRLLEGTVRKGRAGRKTLPLICDSKRAYSRSSSRPLEHLERGVLGMLAAMSDYPSSLAGLLGLLAPRTEKLLGGYPWYSNGELPLPNCITSTEVKLVGNALKTGMRKAQISPAAIRAETLLAGDFNRLARATRNKSIMLMDTTARLLDWIWAKAPQRQMVRIYVDRQGGRIRYLGHLQRIFPHCRFKVLQENPKTSAYEMSEGEKTAQIIFHVSGDDNFLPVALGSMVSKYIRELFMIMFNRFWARHVSAVSGTSGYHADARQFYKKIRPALTRLGIDENLIYRIR